MSFRLSILVERISRTEGQYEWKVSGQDASQPQPQISARRVESHVTGALSQRITERSPRSCRLWSVETRAFAHAYNRQVGAYTTDDTKYYNGKDTDKSTDKTGQGGRETFHAYHGAEQLSEREAEDGAQGGRAVREMYDRWT